MKRCLGVGAAVAVGVVLLAMTGGGVNAATCTLIPTLQGSTVTQGLNSYSALARGKETLVRLYLTLPSCAANTNAIRVNSAQATVTVKDAASGAVQSTTPLSPTAPIPDSAGNYPQITNLTALAAVAPSDPMFVIPGSLLAPVNDVNRLTITVTGTIGYQVLPSGTATTMTFPAARAPAITKTVEKKTNALRVLVVPFANPLDTASNANLQNALTTFSRLLPLPDGTTLPTTTAGARVGSLNTVDGGLRYSINAGTLNLASLGITMPFCGTSASFGTTSNPPNPSTIRGQLAQFMTSWNAVNDANHKADKVLGVVNDLDSTSSAVNPSCYEGMASLTSPEAWVRASTFAGGTGGMELLHTFGVVPFARSDGGYHSPNVQADTAAGDVNKGYNVTDRAYLSDDRTVMYFSPPGYGNNNVLLESGDWSYILCKLGGATTSECTTTAAVAGTATGVQAQAPPPAFNIVAVTNGSVANVVESFVASVPKTQPGDPASPYTIQQFNASGGLLGTPAKIDLSVTDTHHGGVGDLDGSANATGLIAASVPLNANTKTVKLLNGSNVLYSTTLTGLPSVTNPTATLGSGEEVAPGSNTTISHSVATPVIPPKPDVLFLADTTGSMGGALAGVQTNIGSIIATVQNAQHDSAFGAANYRDVVCDGSAAYKLDNAITTDTAAVTTAVGTWAASGGCDTPEDQLNALYQIATHPETVGWRPGSTRIIAWFGDSNGHDPSPLDGGHSLDEVIAALNAEHIRVVAVPVTDDGGNGLTTADEGTHNKNQPALITAATGGSLQAGSGSSEVSAAITAGLQNLPTTVTASGSCTGGLSISFADPNPTTVTSGSSATFNETITVPSGTNLGAYSCTAHFALDGAATPGLDQTISVDVTGLTGQHALITWTPSDDNLAKDKFDIALDCNGVKSILAVALTTSFYDTDRQCPNGGGTYYVIPNDGFSQGAPAPVATPLTQTPQEPTAAISGPAGGTTIGEHNALTLTGSGYDYKSGGPIPPSGLHWSIDGNPVGTGPEVLVNSGLGVGSHQITLDVTDSNGTHSSTTVTITSSNDADGDLITIDQENAIDACKPASSPSGDSDPTNGSKDWDGDGIPNRDDAAPCTPSPIQGQGLFVRNPFKLSGTDNFSLSGIFVPGVDLGLALRSSVQLTEIAGQLLPNPIANSGWLALNQIGAAVFSHSAVATALAPFVGHTIRLTLVGSGPGYSFYVYFDVTVAP